MRVLLVCDPPLDPKYGAAQSVLGLAYGLRRLGHEVVPWSTSPVPADTHWWRDVAARSEHLLGYLSQETRFDIIDGPAALLSKVPHPRNLLVARSVQPELQYRHVELREALKRRPISLFVLAQVLSLLQVRRQLLAGWRASDWIQCLGTLESEWMSQAFPELRDRLRNYRIAPYFEDRRALARVRRESRREESVARYLWIGRWSSHKGTRRLLEFASRLRSGESLTIAGCGDSAAADLERRRIASDSVAVVPDFTRDELPHLLQAHTDGLFTSSVEGWGLAMHEMLESGLRVHATRAGGVPDIEPFVGNLLRDFPPGAVTRGSEGIPDWPQYEHHFDWREIARDYLAALRGDAPLGASR